MLFQATYTYTHILIFINVRYAKVNIMPYGRFVKQIYLSLMPSRLPPVNFLSHQQKNHLEEEEEKNV